jgi:hypothetical protein
MADITVIDPTGTSVAAAQNDNGTACSFVQTLANGKTVIESWTSTDKITWTQGGLVLQSGTMIGGSVAWDPTSQTWFGVVADLDTKDNAIAKRYTTRGITLRFSWPMIPRCDVAGAC